MGRFAHVQIRNLDSKDCRFHWWPALAQQTEYLAIETTWNLSTNTFVRDSTFHGHWFQHWIDSVDGFKFSRWNDANPISDDYVGHPMMGAITMDIFLQNYPRGMSIEFQNTKEYWHSRLWALLWSTIYSTQWKLGPISEASIGNTGRLGVFDKNAGHKTNGTGTVGLVITPLGGWVWTLGEDFVDLHLIRAADAKPPIRFFCLGWDLLNPCRSFANLMRFKAPWYRDSRPVRPHRTWPTLPTLRSRRRLGIFSTIRRLPKHLQYRLFAHRKTAHLDSHSIWLRWGSRSSAKKLPNQKHMSGARWPAAHAYAISSGPVNF